MATKLCREGPHIAPCGATEHKFQCECGCEPDYWCWSQEWSHMLAIHRGELVRQIGPIEDNDPMKLDISTIHYQFHADGQFPDHEYEDVRYG